MGYASALDVRPFRRPKTPLQPSPGGGGFYWMQDATYRCPVDYERNLQATSYKPQAASCRPLFYLPHRGRWRRSRRRGVVEQEVGSGMWEVGRLLSRTCWTTQYAVSTSHKPRATSRRLNPHPGLHRGGRGFFSYRVAAGAVVRPALGGCRHPGLRGVRGRGSWGKVDGDGELGLCGQLPPLAMYCSSCSIWKRCSSMIDLTTSPIETKPTRRPSSMTGRCRTRLSVISAMHCQSVVSGAT